MMHGHEKSDSAIVAVKPTNKALHSAAEQSTAELFAAEPVEPRAETKRNAGQQSTCGTQGQISVSQALERIRRVAKERKKEKLTSLLHQISIDLLDEAFFELKEEAAPGVDGLTWTEYEQNLDGNIEDLHARVHRGAYRALPSRRVYIPKPDGRQRPLAVAALEDKIVQRATAAVLNAIYEEDFLGFSYGFRPGRGAHDALDALAVGINSRKVNFILDADIRAFFDTVDHDWLIGFVEYRIGDKRIIRLIQKWLKVGVLEDGVVTASDRGTGQGSVISPLLANIYLRSLGRTLATARSHGRHDHRALCRRPRCRLRARGGRPALPGRDARAVREVLAVAPPGEDPVDRVRTPCGGKPQAARARQAGDLQLPGLHLHQRQVASGQVPDQTEVPTRPHAGEAASDQTGTASADAPADPGPGEMAATGRQGLLQLPRRADQQPGAGCIPLLCHRTLAAIAQAAQSERRHDLGADYAAGQRLAPETGHPSSMAKNTLRRHPPKVGAVCGKAARTVLCGGRSAMSVPTAIASLAMTLKPNHAVAAASRTTGRK